MNLQQCSGNYFHKELLGVKCFEGAFVLPGNEMGAGGVITKNGEYIDGTYLHKGLGSKYCFNDYSVEDCDVVYVGMFHDVWGHCLSDNIQHFWFLFQNDLQWTRSLRFVYTTVFEDFSPPIQFLQLLANLGIDFEQLQRVTNVTCFNKVYVVDDSILIDDRTGLRLYTSEYKQILDKISSRVTIPRNDIGLTKVFFSRSGFPSKKDFGEQRIESAFKSSGFTIVHPESLSFEEQVNIVQNASIFAATEGSISMNAAFLKDGASLVLVRKGAITSYQHMINEMRSLDVTIIDAHKSSQIDNDRPWLGPFFLYCNKNLASYLGIRKPPFPIVSYLRYLTRFKYIPQISLINKRLRRRLKKIAKCILN